jgi:D-glycero-D-manno-heptose 1,7-bisphosphate phosphatase
MNKALFIDRDGVINRERNYVYRIDDFEFLPGIFTSLKKFNYLGYLIIIITNQAGIGRGIYTEEDYNKLTTWMLDEFKNNGVEITDVYFDPYHPEHGVGKYKKESYDRKPNPGMILKASEKHALNLKKSILIGDKLSDIQAGLNAEVGKLFMVSTGHKTKGVPVPYECKLVNSLDEVLKML